MADPEVASFWTQADALLRKNLTFQKRNIWTNVRLVMIPFYLCILLVLLQMLIDTQYNNNSENQCGCACIDANRDGQCERTCGIQYSSIQQGTYCPIPSPPQWPPLLQIPAPEYRAVITNFLSYSDLPDDSCRATRTCPATMLLTGGNRSLGQTLSGYMFGSLSLNSSDSIGSLASNALGTASETRYRNFLEPAIISSLPIYFVQYQCSENSTFSVPVKESSIDLLKQVKCVEGLNIWRNSSFEVDDVLYKGYLNGNPARKINEIVAAYDFLNTDKTSFNVTIWYNSTYKRETMIFPIAAVRVTRSVNLVSNAYLRFLKGPGTRILFAFVKEMPKPETDLRLDIASLIGPLFFSWVVMLLFPVILQLLVYEKQQRLRIMMKMHGLSDGPYWMISYIYFLVISSLYMVFFMIFGSAVGLKFFRLNDYSIQLLFYFICINLQISLAFLAAAIFSNVKTATVVAYIIVYGSGLLGFSLFQFFIEDLSFPRSWVVVMELYPGFSLYRGLYEFSQYAFHGNLSGTGGMRWSDFGDNGIKEASIIMLVEWFLVLISAFYIDRISSSGKSPLSFVVNTLKRHSSSLRQASLGEQGLKVSVEIEQPDVSQERDKVEQLLLEPRSHAILCVNLKKVYPGRDGNPPKFAVRGLSLALSPGECFGMLGPNGAGKTSFMNMMTGLTKPTSGTAYVQGQDIRTSMNSIYTSIGVCPQHELIPYRLLWETLTGREHLLFYGRLKNLKGSALIQAVEESLQSVNLFNGGIADKQAGKYSGGMKRRLSVAISLIGNPKVVYMDEPSTGLDPASRKSLWNAIKRAKRHTAIILTTHSMEEAEVLCDRLGIFVNGSLQCMGNPKELKARYGGSYVLTITSSPVHAHEVEKLVGNLSSHAKKIYHVAGTQKFELPKQDVRITNVFQAVENAKTMFTVNAWGLADTTLEDVFIKVAKAAQSFNVLS